MLTRLKVKGFKNLADVDVAFGPFTCIAGVNGVGKSNLFDAIVFLSALADRSLLDAAKSVRDEQHRSTDLRSLFRKVGDQHLNEMSFDAEMLIPAQGQDDLGQPAQATITFLRYQLELRYRRDREAPLADSVEVAREELTHINIGDARSHLPFPHSLNWRRSVANGRRAGGAFISTEQVDGKTIIKLHQDGGSGRPRRLPAGNLLRTVLSSASSESPTALLCRREMQAWRLLQLEPSALRASDPFHASAHVGRDGAHLAATLHRLAIGGQASDVRSAMNTRVANRLSELVDDVRGVCVDEDRTRELFTLQVVDRNGNVHAARALSDGSLRFLALAILEMDPHAQGLLCFEEPENGIHPRRIEALLRLLKELAVDTEDEVGADNPLRQVIVNTHSPSVVGLVDDADLLVAESVEGREARSVRFTWLADTWRVRTFPDQKCVSRGLLGAYLNPLAVEDEESEQPRRSRRVKDREDLSPLVLSFDS